MTKGPIALIVATFVAGCVYTLAHHGVIQVEQSPAAVTTVGTVGDVPVSKTTVIDPKEAQSLLSTVSAR